MIYTVTFNPALDYVVRLPELAPGEVNRTDSEDIQLGGKGINVSCVLGQLGFESVALGFVAGFTGEAVEAGLARRGVKSDFIRLPEGLTRINVNIKAGAETEINGRGPAIPAAALEERFGILTRVGLHCAPSAHKTLGTFPQGTVRFSLGWASAEADVDAALAAIRALA